MNLQTAQALMGDHVVTPEEVEKCTGFVLSPEVHESLAVIPFKEELVRHVQVTHYLIPGFPVSIQELSSRFQECIQPKDWYESYAFYKEPLPVMWYLVSRSPVSKSHLTHLPEWLKQYKPRRTYPDELMYCAIVALVCRRILFVDQACCCRVPIGTHESFYITGNKRERLTIRRLQDQDNILRCIEVITPRDTHKP